MHLTAKIVSATLATAADSVRFSLRLCANLHCQPSSTAIKCPFSVPPAEAGGDFDFPMKNYLLLITLVSAIWFSGCTGHVAKADPPAYPPVIKRSEATDPAIKNEIAKYADEAKGKVGVGALDLETGEYFSLNGDGQYPMQSVYKLPISLAVIKQCETLHLDIDHKIAVTKDDFVRPGQHSPIRDKFPDGTEMSVRELIKYALEESDGTASDVLMDFAGGPNKIQDYLGSIGITDMKVLNTEKELGANWRTQYENWSTPEAAVALLHALYEGRALSSETGRELVLQMMTNSTPGQNRIRGLLEDAPVAHKTGTSGAQDGITAATNDIGIVTLPNGKHFGVAVFVSDSNADEKTREAAIAKITKVLWNYWKR
jgi:beta-lactamase class A